GRGARGSASLEAARTGACSASSDVSATLPRLAPSPYRKSRRVGAHRARAPAQGKRSGMAGFLIILLINIDKFVGVEQAQAHFPWPADGGADVGGVRFRDVGRGRLEGLDESELLAAVLLDGLSAHLDGGPGLHGPERAVPFGHGGPVRQAGPPL